MSRTIPVPANHAAGRGIWSAVSAGLSAWLVVYLVARYTVLRYEDQLPGTPRPRRRNAKIICSDCDKYVEPRQTPSGQLSCPECGGQNLRER
jgi:hypothetical protein